MDDHGVEAIVAERDRLIKELDVVSKAYNDLLKAGKNWITNIDPYAPCGRCGECAQCALAACIEEEVV